ncbi:MAG: sigma-E factor negative regulatory protein [Nitrosomonadales bacterium]|nr:sigma-E factor negative regulatory protein [Nitrosomonadales bacterium]
MNFDKKQEVSALMDGELFEDEAGNLLGKIRYGSEAHQNWEIYHLIGDVLRQPEHIPTGLSASVHRRLQEEPTVLAPRIHSVKRKVQAFAFSAAASLVAVGMVVWMSLQIGPEGAPKMAMRQDQQGALRMASVKSQLQSNDYLLAHQEFSPSTDMNGGASYIRTVAYRAEGQ